MTGARRRAAGVTLVELMAGLALGLGVTTAAVGAVAAGLRMLGRLALRAEHEDIAHAAVEALAFDVRRAGLDPRGAGLAAIAEARIDRVTLHADLDGDGVVAGGSQETTAYVCDLATGRLSRVLGAQSLPLANDVVTCGLGYVDATGTPLVVPPGGLDAAARRDVRLIVLDLAVAPPGLGATTSRRAAVALRGAP